ncbi:MAG: helix-turn-helix transcriptional regulator [Cyclobacteriaceae bacterium]
MKGVSAESRLFIYVRKQLGLSQRKMAVKLGINQSSISKIESGVHRPRVSTIRKLERLVRKPADTLACEALGMPVPEPTPMAAPKQQEARVIKINPRYRHIDTRELEYLHARFSMEANELKRKALHARYTLEAKALRTRLHRITWAYIIEEEEQAETVHALLQEKAAPARLKEYAGKQLMEVKARKLAEKSYGIHLRTVPELMLEDVKVEAMELKSESRSQQAAQIKRILKDRKRRETGNMLPMGRVATLPKAGLVAASV